MGFLHATKDIICKYVLLVLVFSLFGALQLYLFEPPLKKLLKIGPSNEHEVKWEIILVKSIIFVVGVLILFLMFGNRFLKCTTTL